MLRAGLTLIFSSRSRWLETTMYWITSCHLCPFSGVVVGWASPPPSLTHIPPLHSTLSLYRRRSCTLCSIHTIRAVLDSRERISSCLKLLKTAYRIKSGVQRYRSLAEQPSRAHLLPYYSLATPVYHSRPAVSLLQQRVIPAAAVLVSRSRQGLSWTYIYSHHPKITRQWIVSRSWCTSQWRVMRVD